MRGAGPDETGRELLFRYYGQIELLDLRFPVDENHIKISFTWLDAFLKTPTAQHSLAFEKASVIFNIASVHSSIALKEWVSATGGMKKAFHLYQGSAGLFAYINDNFLHAPSLDLGRNCVQTLSHNHAGTSSGMCSAYASSGAEEGELACKDL